MDFRRVKCGRERRDTLVHPDDIMIEHLDLRQTIELCHCGSSGKWVRRKCSRRPPATPFSQSLFHHFLFSSTYSIFNSFSSKNLRSLSWRSNFTFRLSHEVKNSIQQQMSFMASPVCSHPSFGAKLNEEQDIRLFRRYSKVPLSWGKSRTKYSPIPTVQQSPSFSRQINWSPNLGRFLLLFR